MFSLHALYTASSGVLSCDSCSLSAGVHGRVIHSARRSAVCHTTVSHRYHLDLTLMSTTSVLRYTWLVLPVCVADSFESQLNFHQTSGFFSFFLGLHHFLNAHSFKLLQYYNFYFCSRALSLRAQSLELPKVLQESIM